MSSKGLNGLDETIKLSSSIALLPYLPSLVKIRVFFLMSSEKIATSPKLNGGEGYPASWDLQESVQDDPGVVSEYPERNIANFRDVGVASVEPIDKNENTQENSELDTVLGWLDDNGYSQLVRAMSSCVKGWKRGERVNKSGYFCDDGHLYLRRVYCGRQVCPICGEKDSSSHRRRIRRAESRLMWADVLGYVDLTIPMEHREVFRDRKKLEAAIKAAWSVVAYIFLDVFDQSVGGMVTVHFFGDKSNRFNPHINIIFASKGHIDKLQLDRLKQLWLWRLSHIVGELIPREKANAYYDYSAFSKHYLDAVERAEEFCDPKPSKAQVNQGMKQHYLSYILRSTIPFDRFCGLSNKMRRWVLGLLYSPNGKKFTNVRWFGDLRNSYYRRFFQTHKEIEIPLPSDFVVGRHTFLCPKCGAESDGYRCLECSAWCDLKPICPVCGGLFCGGFSVKAGERTSSRQWVEQAETEDGAQVWVESPQGRVYNFFKYDDKIELYAELETYKLMVEQGLLDDSGVEDIEREVDELIAEVILSGDR